MKGKVIFTIICALLFVISLVVSGWDELVPSSYTPPYNLDMNGGVPNTTKSAQDPINFPNPNKIEEVIVQTASPQTYQSPPAPILQEIRVSYIAGAVDGWRLIEMTNNHRQSIGLGPLVHSTALSQAAYAKAQDMLAKQYWSHYGPSGETPWQFMNASGYYFRLGGENLAYGFNVSEQVHKGWIDSPAHLANIIEPEYAEIGIAVISGQFMGSENVIVVQMFGVR